VKITATIEITVDEVIAILKGTQPSQAKKPSVNVEVRTANKEAAQKRAEQLRAKRDRMAHARAVRAAKRAEKMSEKNKAEPAKAEPAKSERKKRSTKPRTFTKWTPSQESWLLDAMKGRAPTSVSKEIAKAFQQRFGFERSLKSLSMKSQELHGLRDKYRFKKK
jgi:hypothetical protein